MSSVPENFLATNSYNFLLLYKFLNFLLYYNYSLVYPYGCLLLMLVFINILLRSYIFMILTLIFFFNDLHEVTCTVYRLLSLLLTLRYISFLSGDFCFLMAVRDLIIVYQVAFKVNSDLSVLSLLTRLFLNLFITPVYKGFTLFFVTKSPSSLVEVSFIPVSIGVISFNVGLKTFDF